MIIHIQDETVEMNNDVTKIKEILKIINGILIKRNLEFGYLIIDDQPIYDDFINYFSEHIAEIEEVEVVAVATIKLVKDTISSTEQYLAGAIPQVNALAEEFYQQPGEKTWMKLIDLFEGIQWIIETVVKIDGVRDLNSMVTDYGIWNEYVQAVSELTKVIQELEAAMISKDNVLIGDLLLYEIIPVLGKMEDLLKFLFTQGVQGNVS